MNKAKSLFISLHVLLINIALVHLIVVSWHEPLNSAWMGVFILALSNLYFFVWLFLGRAARTSRNLHFLIALDLMGFGLVATDVTADQTVWAVVYGFTLFFSSLAYIFWYSRLGDRDNALLKEGQKLPYFQVIDLEGKKVTLESLKGSAWLLIFYRGNWCPLCMAQIREVAGQYIDLDRCGVKIALISSQSAKHTADLAARFDVPLHFFLDENLTTAKQLKLVHENGLPMGLQALGYDSDTVLPTVLMINRHGRIVYSDQTSNYRVRPDPEQFMEVARQKLQLTEAEA